MIFYVAVLALSQESNSLIPAGNLWSVLCASGGPNEVFFNRKHSPGRVSCTGLVLQ